MVASLKAVRRTRDAEALFERLLRLRNDLGLLSEEYDVDRKRLDSLLWREYRVKVGEIMNHVGSATLVDSQGGTRVVLPGSPGK